MMMTTTMTLPALITACSMASSTLVDDLLYNVVMGHSKGNYLYIHNYSTNASYHPSTKAQAVALAKAFTTPHHHIHVGLAGLNPVHIKKWKLGLTQGFDACTNIKVASLELLALMKKYKVTRRTKATEHRIHKALAQYYLPQTPTHTDAIDWGALILSQAQVSVAKQLVATHPLPTSTYTIYRPMIKNVGIKNHGVQIIGHGSPGHDGAVIVQKKPKKFAIKPAKKPATKKAKKANKRTSLKPKDMLPNQIGGPIRKVINEKLP